MGVSTADHALYGHLFPGKRPQEQQVDDDSETVFGKNF